MAKETAAARAAGLTHAPKVKGAMAAVIGVAKGAQAEKSLLYPPRQSIRPTFPRPTVPARPSRPAPAAAIARRVDASEAMDAGSGATAGQASPPARETVLPVLRSNPSRQPLV